jgi:hypothetical protein
MDPAPSDEKQAKTRTIALVLFEDMNGCVPRKTSCVYTK